MRNKDLPAASAPARLMAGACLRPKATISLKFSHAMTGCKSQSRWMCGQLLSSPRDLDGLFHAFAAGGEVDPAVVRKRLRGECAEDTAQIVVDGEGDELALGVKIGLQVAGSVEPGEAFAEVGQIVG